MGEALEEETERSVAGPAPRRVGLEELEHDHRRAVLADHREKRDLVDARVRVGVALLLVRGRRLDRDRVVDDRERLTGGQLEQERSLTVRGARDRFAQVLLVLVVLALLRLATDAHVQVLQVLGGALGRVGRLLLVVGLKAHAGQLFSCGTKALRLLHVAVVREGDERVQTQFGSPGDGARTGFGGAVWEDRG